MDRALAGGVDTSPSINSKAPAEEIAALTERSPADLANALGVLRERIDQEFRITERLDSKSRQAFTLAAGFFAVAQATAFASFGQTSVTQPERIAILIAALLTVISLALTAVRLHRSEELRTEGAMPPRSVFNLCRDQSAPNSVTAHLIWTLSEVARQRIDSNRVRVEQTRLVARAAQLTFAFAVLELAVALMTRI